MKQAAFTIETGAELPSLTRQITQETINAYAEASGDRNPLHVDPEYAATTQFGGPIAHGMLVLALVSEMLTAAFGETWLRTGRLKARFRGAARPGDAVTVRGTVKTVEAGASTHVVVECVNQAGEVLLSGDAQVGGS
jgi:3-hydroxybutyryl-CoA dehydratase